MCPAQRSQRSRSRRPLLWVHPRLACFTVTKVPILPRSTVSTVNKPPPSPLGAPSLCLLYWYKSTNTHANTAIQLTEKSCRPLCHTQVRQHTSAYVSIRQYTSVYVSILAYASIRQHKSASSLRRKAVALCVTLRHVSIRQHTSAYVIILAYVSIRQHKSASSLRRRAVALCVTLRRY